MPNVSVPGGMRRVLPYTNALRAEIGPAIRAAANKE
jgi:hypothetical protein